MTLVQIDKTPIPPWHQSTEFLTSCPTLYVETAIKGKGQPGGMDSARGNEVHRAGAAYAAYCALKGISSDLQAFDEFAAGAGPLAARILAGMRDSYEVDYRHLLATELTLSLDEKFRPTDIPEQLAFPFEENDAEAVVVGTLDALYSFPEQAAMRIDDLKTHPRPFDPNEKLQGKTYALMVFLHFPLVERVEFRLIFVRYRNVTRSVEFTRDMIPDLMAAVSSARERQIKIHTDYAAGKTMEALAGNHCWYCPLMSNGACPIAEYNAQMQLTPAERLNFNLWYGVFSKINNAAMKSYIQETGRPVVLKDFNGKCYTYGPVEKESEVYPVFQFGTNGMEFITAASPVMPIIDLLIDYACDNQADSEWMKNVVISSTSLKKYLKANKRSFLDQAIEDTATKVTKTPLRVSKPLDAVPEEPEWDEEEFDDEEEF
jgi:hypothetical protein